MSGSRVAVVTGGNKGIGFAIVKGLCSRFEGQVYLTARNEELGKEAVKKLNDIGLKPLFHQLDISDAQSLKNFRNYIEKEHAGIDLLVNNAAIAFKSNSTVPFGEQARETCRVNYFSVASTCDTLFPLLKSGARVVTLSSMAGHLSRLPDGDVKERFKNENLKRADLDKLVKEFVESAQDGSNVEKGWGNGAYIVSKVAVTAFTFLQNREYGSKNISINCVDPGYVDTDMSSHKGHLTPDQGAEAALYLALDAPADMKGVFMGHNKNLLEWTSKTAPPYK